MFRRKAEVAVKNTRDEIKEEDVKNWTVSYSMFVTELHRKLLHEYRSHVPASGKDTHRPEEQKFLEPIINELASLIKIVQPTLELEKVGLKAEVKSDKEEKIVLPDNPVKKYLFMRDTLQACILNFYIDLYAHQRTREFIKSGSDTLQKRFQDIVAKVSDESKEDILFLKRKTVYGKNEIDSKILNTVTADSNFSPELREQLNTKIFKSVLKTLSKATGKGEEKERESYQLGFVNLMKEFYRMNQLSTAKDSPHAVKCWNNLVAKLQAELPALFEKMDKVASELGAKIDREQVNKFVGLLKIDGKRNFGETTKHGLPDMFKEVCAARDSYDVSCVLETYVEGARSRASTVVPSARLSQSAR